jgi:hypothetical protein
MYRATEYYDQMRTKSGQKEPFKRNIRCMRFRWNYPERGAARDDGLGEDLIDYMLHYHSTAPLAGWAFLR